jgi:predicted DNA-binding ribbon-helix-helix protein
MDWLARLGKEITHAQETTLSELVAKIDQTREQGNLSSAIRLYVLEHVRRPDPKPLHVDSAGQIRN